MRSRGVWFWAITGTATSVAVLFVGSQIAHDRGQTVEWYTGFGQWLGGLGSLVAATVALWIAVTDRRHTEKQLEADLTREAALVRVMVKVFSPRDDFSGVPIPTAGIRVTNRRAGRIFEIEVVRFLMEGKEVSPVRLSSIDLFPKPKDAYYTANELQYLSLDTEQSLYLYPNELPNVAADYVAVAYTDLSGRRWKVDTDLTVERIV
jgi:hypothetical protein